MLAPEVLVTQRVRDQVMCPAGGLAQQPARQRAHGRGRIVRGLPCTIHGRHSSKIVDEANDLGYRWHDQRIEQRSEDGNHHP